MRTVRGMKRAHQRTTRAVSLLETVFAFVSFAVAMSLLIAVIGTALGSRHEAFSRSALTEQLNTLVAEAADIPTGDLLNRNFMVPAACPGAPTGPTGTSCVTVTGRTLVASWNLTRTATDTLVVEAAAVDLDGNRHVRRRTVPIERLASINDRLLSVNVAGDVHEVGQLLLVDRDSPTTVVASAAVSAGGPVATFSVPSGSCNIDAPCRVALTADSNEFALSDRAALTPESALGPAANIVLSRNAVTEMTVEVRQRTRMSFNYVSGLAPGVPLCLELRFWLGGTEKYEENFCADTGSNQVLIDTFEPESDVILAIPVGREIALELAVGGPPPSYTGVRLMSGDDVNLDVEFDGQQLLLSNSAATPAYDPLPDRPNLSLVTVDGFQGGIIDVDVSASQDGSALSGEEVSVVAELPLRQATSCVTDAAGLCTVTLAIPPSTPSTEYTMFASAPGGGTASLTFAVLPAATDARPVDGPVRIPAGATTPVAFTLADGNGNSSAGTLTIAGAGISASPATADVDGHVTVSMMVDAATPIGRASVAADIDGRPLSIPIEVVAVPSELTVSTTPATAAGVILLAVTAADAAGNPAAHATLGVATTGPALTVDRVITNTAGHATIPVWLPSAGSSSVNVTSSSGSAQVQVSR